MTDAGLPTGTYIPCTSRTKCMAMGLRDGARKTNCCLPKEHDGPHRNVRGEEWQVAATRAQLSQADKAHMKDLENEVAAMRKQIAEFLKVQAAKKKARKVKKIRA